MRPIIESKFVWRKVEKTNDDCPVMQSGEIDSEILAKSSLTEETGRECRCFKITQHNGRANALTAGL